MAAAKFDANKDLELHWEGGPRRALNMWRLPKDMTAKIKNLIFFLMIILILILIGVIIFRETAPPIESPKNYQNLQVKGLGPNGPVTLGKSCGGVVDVKMIGTTILKLTYLVSAAAAPFPVTFIIRSDAKMVNLTWNNGRGETIPNDEPLVGELIDNELHNCRNIGEASGTTTTIIHTPAILQIQPPATDYALIVSEIEFTPITWTGTHKSQPAAYKYVSDEPRGELAISNDVIVAVLEDNSNRQLYCSHVESSGQCCESVKAYRFNSTNPASSCTPLPLPNLNRPESTLVLLSSPQGKSDSQNCQLNWDEV